jgi:signal transduction histidine kinase
VSNGHRPQAQDHRVFRVRLRLAIMLVVSAVTASSLYLAQRNMAADAERDLQRDFQNELTRGRVLREARRAALAERCRTLVRRPRIHAALEDNALDLLYPSAKDELRDVLAEEEDAAPELPGGALRARFYRFLDAQGAVIPPPAESHIGALRPEEEAQLSVGTVLEREQIAYLVRAGAGGREMVDAVMTMPIFSSDTGEFIAALALGFEVTEPRAENALGALWIGGRLHLHRLDPATQQAVSAEVSRAIAAAGAGEETSGSLRLQRAPHLLFCQLLNPGSLFPSAYEICLYPLAGVLARQRQVLWQIGSVGAMLLLAGLVASHFVSARFAAPVEKLAGQRERAEAALETTSRDLQRSARFSADASHQLKTPVTVMRAGLEQLLALPDLPHEAGEEVAGLIHQTYRLGSIIEDLLLLSRVDAGRLRIEFAPVDLTQLVEAMVDDLSALPDPLDVQVETDCPALVIAGEKRYVALILQNLLENARKYNRPGGCIRIGCHEGGEWARITVGNTGLPIPPAAQEQIFERFHRGAMGENLPGHGLGLNLARELARLHGGDLRLARSAEDWTEFEVRFRRFVPARSDAPREIA